MDTPNRDSGRWMFWVLVIIGIALIVGAIAINISNTLKATDCIIARGMFEAAVTRLDAQVTHENVQEAARRQIAFEAACEASEVAEVLARLGY